MQPQLKCLAAAIVAAALLPAAAWACTIRAPIGGTMRANSDNTVLGSQVNGTTPGTITMVLPALSAATITVGAPTRLDQPAGYNSSGESIQLSYVASVAGLLPFANVDYTSSPTSFSPGLLSGLLLTITMHNRIINPSGFPPWTYRTRTMVTCHP